MAITATITRLSATEVLPLVQTPITSLFSHMLGAATAHIRSESRLEQLDLTDPAHALWLRSSDEAKTAMSCFLAEIQKTAAVSALDSPLIRMSRLFDVMTRSEDPGSFMRVHAQSSRYARFLRVRRQGPDAAAVASLITRAQRCIAFMSELTLYNQEVGVLAHAGGDAGDPGMAAAA